MRASAGVPFQRLPALAAVFLAEAAAALAHPSAPLYAPVNKHLLRAPALDLQVGFPSKSNPHTMRSRERSGAPCTRLGDASFS